MTEKTIHEGRNVKRIRKIPGIKQDALAMDLGLKPPGQTLIAGVLFLVFAMF